MRKIGMPIVVVVIVSVVIVISLIVSLIISPPKLQTVPQSHPAVSTVVFTEDASLPDTPNNGIEPKVIRVVIGVNNTVRWENHDTIPHGFPIPDDESVDPDFAKFIAMKYEENGFIMPKQSFEYTFAVPSRIDYHMVPHPQMKGTVIVLSNDESKTEQALPIISGIACNRTEQLVYHIHAHIDVFVNGSRVQVPAYIGIDPSFHCIYWLHTHSNDGLIHIESPKVKIFTLEQFLEIWRQTGNNGESFFSSVSSMPVTIYVNGTEFFGSYQNLKLDSREQITLAYGLPPENIPTYDFGNLDKPRVNNTKIQ